MDIKTLQERFSSHKEISFRTLGDGLVMVNINNSQASASISLQGAMVTNWAPTGQQAVIWVSENSFYEVGRSVRGGVPVCWPWFGPHETESSFPAHGFVRAKMWALDTFEQLKNGASRLQFSYSITNEDKQFWPHKCTLQLIVTIGTQLEIALRTHNSGQQSFTISEALHTYFNISNIDKVSVSGLEGGDYLDKVDGFKQKTQQGKIAFNGEVDRVYLDTQGTCRIEDPIMKRDIVISNQGSDSTVVWNPWEERSIAMADMGKQAYRTMLCVETANAASNKVQLAAGDTHTMQAIYSLEARQAE